MRFLFSFIREQKKIKEVSVPCVIRVRRGQFFRALFHEPLSNDFPYSFSCSKKCAHLKDPQTKLVPLSSRSTMRNGPIKIVKIYGLDKLGSYSKMVEYSYTFFTFI